MSPFIDIPSCTVTLGWRFDEVLPREAISALDSHFEGYAYGANLFSPRRTIHLDPFRISSKPLPWMDLVSDTQFIEEAGTLDEICKRMNEQLKVEGLRLPTEDELEAAAGGSLFSWGNQIPEGIPYGDRTRFTGHTLPARSGILLNADTYATELVDGYFKFGDGGVTVCGGEPWPMAWLSLAVAFRVPNDMYSECLAEYLETTVLHPVKIGEPSDAPQSRSRAF